MGNLAVRSLSALILAPIVIFAEWQGGLYFEGLMLILLGLAFHEWFSICRDQGSRLSKIAWFAVLTTGGAYIGAACFSLAWLRATHPDGAMLVLLVLLAVWAADSGAYFTGKLIGGPKLAPTISPKKTWAGFFGGLIAATGVGLIMSMSGEPGANTQLIAAMAFIFGLLAMVGDLIQSWMKRRFDIKDSGTIIPGHGGILDRVDGLLAAAIGAAVMVKLTPTGVMMWP